MDANAQLCRRGINARMARVLDAAPAAQDLAQLELQNVKGSAVSLFTVKNFEVDHLQSRRAVATAALSSPHPRSAVLACTMLCVCALCRPTRL